MSVDYGITFCKKVLADLRKIENQRLREKGYGFDYFSQEMQTEKKYKILLKTFQREKKLGLSPSYDPNYHGSFLE